MANIVEVKVPDIGDFAEVPVIELFVKPGDQVEAEDSLCTLESDKATMDVPAPCAGKVQNVVIKVGDRVSEGGLLLTLEAADGKQEVKPSTHEASSIPAKPVESSSTEQASQLITVTVPDIGDFNQVPVIELFVKPGDVLAAEDSICTLESDKATMDVPAPCAGVVQDVFVKVGSKMDEGNALITLQSHQPSSGKAESQASVPSQAPAPAKQDIQTAVVQTQLADDPNADMNCDVLVLGAGPGGYSAAFRSADLGMKTILVERYATLGGVCLNVGCIPSKALLHVANVMDEVRHFEKLGLTYEEPKLDLDKLRQHKEKVVAKLTGGLSGMAKARKVDVVHGQGTFTDAHHLVVELMDGKEGSSTGTKKTIFFRQAIIACGSQSVSLPFMPKDPRVIDSTGALALNFVPKKMLIIGGGIIGLEMATVYANLGSQIDIVEMLDGLMQGADRDLAKVWEKKNLSRFGQVMLKTKTVNAEAREDGICVHFEHVDGSPVEVAEKTYDLVLVSVGRRPNGKSIGADAAGVAVDERGFIAVDKQMRTNIPHIFAIGDVVGQPMLAHKAVHEAHVAAEVAAGHKVGMDALQIPAVAYTDPEVAWAGLTELQAKEQGVAYEKAVFPWAASGRAIANGRDEGFTKLLISKDTGRVIGGGIVGTHAGDLIGEICLAVEMGASAEDIARTIHPHPTLCESIGMAAEVFEGSCTDMPPIRKK